MKTPAFQFYPQDFLSSPDVQMMTTQEVGAYCLLLFNSWIYSDNPGYLPNNDKKLQRLSKLNPDEWDEVKDIVLEKFDKSECGQFLFNKRLVKEALKQEQRRQRLAENGSKGGRPKKASKKQTKSKQEPNGNQQVISDKPTDNQNERLSSSSSTSVDNNKLLFDEFRVLYPGSKRGNDTEFENFCKKHKNWKEVLPSLKTLLKQQIEDKQAQASKNQFVAPWPNLSTYINNKRWEDELATPPPKQQTLYEPVPQEHMTEQEVNDLIGLKPDTQVYTPKFKFSQ